MVVAAKSGGHSFLVRLFFFFAFVFFDALAMLKVSDAQSSVVCVASAVDGDRAGCGQ